MTDRPPSLSRRLAAAEAPASAVALARELAQRLLNGKFISLPEALQLQQVADLADEMLDCRRRKRRYMADYRRTKQQ